jgi:hypothetical protein
MKAKYLITNGQSTDLQLVNDDYVAIDGEIIINVVDDKLPNINTLHSIAHLKKKAKLKVRIKAHKLFKERYPDFKVLRHLAQFKAGITTAMTGEEFLSFEQSRQNIRNISNQIETEIDTKTKSQLIGFDVENHPSWP